MSKPWNYAKPVHSLAILVLSGMFLTVNLSSQVYINEVMASNATVYADMDFGKYSDWIELYNQSGQDIDLTGYFLSDDPANLTMWPFQAGTVILTDSFLLVYADGFGAGLHTNFKLAKDGESVLLVGPLGTLIDSVSYPPQLTDISYGRSTDNFQVFGFFDPPSPGEKNDPQSIAGISSTPQFSLASGFYTGPQIVDISTVNQGVTIHYTLDGTEPTASSDTVAGPIAMTQNTVLRVKTMEKGRLTAPATTRTYFIDEPQNLPVISLVTDPAYLFSDETGIYVEGTAGIPGYCTSVPHNVNQDWERPINIELFELDGTKGLNQMAGVKIFGGCSRVRYPMKSFAFYARKEYENSSFNYRLFPDKPSEKYETFILRASADDQPFTLFRDPLAQMLVKDVIDVDMQAYRPVVVYINGEYWGIHNMREKINEQYLEDNYGVNPDSVDLIRNNSEDSWNVYAGNADHYNAMMDYLRENDITQSSTYDYVNTQMDVDEYINYQIIQIFFGGRDWPGNNIKFWRSREEPYNRWRWILYDLDHVFKEFFSDIMDEATEADCGCDWPNPPWSTYLFRRLLENTTFKNEFTQRFALFSGTHFSRDRLHKFINEMQAELAPEIPRHIERWGGQKTNLPDNTWVQPIFNSVAQWEANVQVMRDFTDTRHELAMKHVNDYFGTSGFSDLTTHIQPAGSGHIKIGNTILQDSSSTVEYILGEALSVSVNEEPGYLFSHWQVDQLNTYDTSLITRGDEWKYFISRDIPDTNWTAVDYMDDLWETGMAQLGYGDGDETTVVDFGGDPADKIITTWFRKNFVIDDTSQYSRYTLSLLRDDGARIYLNGLEMVRDNMQRWWVNSYAPSQDTVNWPEETTWFNFGLNPAMFRNGENVVAVEIHQSAGTSSDISFDLELVARSTQPGTQEMIFNEGFALDMLNDREITAVLIADTNIVEQVYINEVMASNNAGLTDELGEYEDWIELYNGGEQAADLAGLFLADTLPAISPWRFPEDQPETTTIEPNGYLVIFADNDSPQGLLHTNFKLSKSGEEVALLQKIGMDTSIVDHLIFGPQYRNITYGRYPDGSPVFEYMSKTTPYASNFAFTIEVETLSEIPGDVSVYPVPTSGPLYIKFSESFSRQDLPVRVLVFSMTGSMVYSALHPSSDLIQLSLENQARGLYIVQVLVGKQRFIKRVVLH